MTFKVGLTHLLQAYLNAIIVEHYINAAFDKVSTGRACCAVPLQQRSYLIMIVTLSIFPFSNYYTDCSLNKKQH